MSEQEVKAFCELLMRCDIDDILENIPSVKRDSFISDMQAIINELKINYNIMYELKEETGTDEFDDKLKEVSYKISYLENRFLKKEEASKEDTYKFKNIPVFAVSDGGNPYFLSDLEKIPSDYYDEVLKTLNLFLNGQICSFDKIRVFKNNDSFVKTVVEYKGFKIRIFTAKLKDNVFYLFGLAMKKSNYDGKITSRMARRLTNLVSSGRFDENVCILENDGILKEELIGKNMKILDDVMSKLCGDKSNSNSNSNSNSVEFLFDESYYDVVEPVDDDDPDNLGNIPPFGNKEADVSDNDSISGSPIVDTGLNDSINDSLSSLVSLEKDNDSEFSWKASKKSFAIKNIKVFSDSVFSQKYKIMKEKILKAFIKPYIKTTDFEKNLSSTKADFGLIFENEEDSVKHCKSK